MATSKFLDHVTSIIFPMTPNTAFHIRISDAQLKTLWSFHSKVWSFGGRDAIHMGTWNALTDMGLIIWVTFTLAEARSHGFKKVTQKELDTKSEPGMFNLTKEGELFCNLLDTVGMFERFKTLKEVA